MLNVGSLACIMRSIACNEFLVETWSDAMHFSKEALQKNDTKVFLGDLFWGFLRAVKRMKAIVVEFL